jgi:hypothetical protein
VNRPTSPKASRRWSRRLSLSVAIVVSGAWAALARAQGPEAYDAPEPERVRRELREIVGRRGRSEPRRDDSWAKDVAEWLGDLFEPLDRLDWIEGIGTAGKVLAVVVTVVLLALMVWAIARWIRNVQRRGSRAGGEVTRIDRPRRMSREQFVDRMHQCAQRGEHLAALGLMLNVLLRDMAQAGRIALDESKTNGQYLREYPRRDDREAFSRFVRHVELRQYRQGACGADDYRRMHRMFEELSPFAGTEQQD